MDEQITYLRRKFQTSLQEAKTSLDIEKIRIDFLGKKGSLSGLLHAVKMYPVDQRPIIGKTLHETKSYITEALEEKKEQFHQEEQKQIFQKEVIDVTLPGRKYSLGSIHPVYQMMEEMIDILIGMGFVVEKSPSIESEYYNYSGLNYPEDHPARDMQDTFYLSKNYLLRSHTTNFQQRMMEKSSPPIRSICPGKCYRNETITPRSHVIFHQVDAMYIDQNVTLADLLATKKEFYSRLFGKEVFLRFRPSYFPFVEPGLEVDIKCTSCEGTGCRLCKDTGWLEVAGTGMIHPEVLRRGGIDSEKYSGYAWGIGVERLFMLRYGVQDIRLFFNNDMRFINQFK